MKKFNFHSLKKPNLPTWLSFCLTQAPILRGTTKVKLYFLCFLLKYLSITEIIKLTIAPIMAKTTVLITSSELRLGNMLKKVPPAVPTKVVLLCGVILLCCQLAHCRDHASCNSHITRNGSNYNWQRQWRS